MCNDKDLEQNPDINTEEISEEAEVVEDVIEKFLEDIEKVIDLSGMELSVDVTLEAGVQRIIFYMLVKKSFNFFI